MCCETLQDIFGGGNKIRRLNGRLAIGFGQPDGRPVRVQLLAKQLGNVVRTVSSKPRPFVYYHIRNKMRTIVSRAKTFGILRKYVSTNFEYALDLS